jgi:hypothetical protein
MSFRNGGVGRFIFSVPDPLDRARGLGNLLMPVDLCRVVGQPCLRYLQRGRFRDCFARLTSSQFPRRSSLGREMVRRSRRCIV